jgi:hypothetical protein
MADGDNLHLGRENTSSRETRITRSGTSTNVSSLVVENHSGDCIVGNSTFVGSPVDTSAYAGVLGTSATGNGVQGVSQEGTGVRGRSNASNGTGVRGEARDAQGRGGTGVWGEAGHTGVFGLANPVGGEGGSVVGVFADAGLENAGDGVMGIGVLATARPFSGLRPGQEIYAGFFGGKVLISGNLFVTDDLTVEGAISSNVRQPDGSTRRMYALASPESWFEDMGRAELVDGRAQVDLDEEFAAMVQTDDYHVFLTPEGDTQGLFVSARTPDGFEVRELQGGTSTLTFSYRVVTKRGDIEAVRMQRTEPPPALADVLPPEVPEPPE